MTKFSFWVNWPFKSLHFPAVCNVCFGFIVWYLESFTSSVGNYSPFELRVYRSVIVTCETSRWDLHGSHGSVLSQQQHLSVWSRGRSQNRPPCFSQTHHVFTPVTVCLEDRTSHRGFPKGFGSSFFFPFEAQFKVDTVQLRPITVCRVNMSGDEWWERHWCETRQKQL